VSSYTTDLLGNVLQVSHLWLRFYKQFSSSQQLLYALWFDHVLNRFRSIWSIVSCYTTDLLKNVLQDSNFQLRFYKQFSSSQQLLYALWCDHVLNRFRSIVSSYTTDLRGNVLQDSNLRE